MTLLYSNQKSDRLKDFRSIITIVLSSQLIQLLLAWHSIIVCLKSSVIVCYIFTFHLLQRNFLLKYFYRTRVSPSRVLILRSNVRYSRQLNRNGENACAVYAYANWSEFVCGRMINSDASARMQLQAPFKFTPAMLIHGQSCSFRIKYVNLYVYWYIRRAASTSFLWVKYLPEIRSLFIYPNVISIVLWYMAAINTWFLKAWC